MNDLTLRLLTILATAGAIATAAPAWAQDMGNPEEGGVWVPPPEDTPPPVQAQPDTSSSPAWYNPSSGGAVDNERPPGQSSESASNASSSNGSSSSASGDARDDHQRFVGRLAFGYQTINSVPIGSVSGGSLAVEAIAAPAIGVRYWVDEMIGIDVGLGLGYQGGNAQVGPDAAPLDNAFALAIHAGIPLAIFHEGHYKLVIIPEVNIAFATGTVFGVTQDQDQARSGFLLSLGGRVGSEIHFGFMGVPQLSLQASVGLYFEYTQAGVGANRSGTALDSSVSGYALGTTVMGEPWDIFLGSLTALYYF